MSELVSEPGTSHEESFVDHRERLDQLAVLEPRLEALRERNCELEVECIMAEAALKQPSAEGPPERDVEAAARVVLALESKRVLELELDALEGRLTDKIDNTRAAQEALQAWLCAPEEEPGHGLPSAVRNVLLGVCVLVIVAAFAIHLAFLILLAPMGAVSAAMWSGDDPAWRRVGAKRRFEATGLAPPEAWDEGAVADRIQVIDEALERESTRLSAVSEGASARDAHRVTAELEQATEALADAMADAGIEARTVDEPLESELRLLSSAYRPQAELEEAKSELRTLNADAEALRSKLFRYLSSQGEAPPGGKADLDALGEGLRRVERKTS